MVSTRAREYSARKKQRWTIVYPTGNRKIGKIWRTARRKLIPASIWPCYIEEELTIVNKDGAEVLEYSTQVIYKDGAVIRYAGKCPNFIEENGVVRIQPRNVDNLEDDKKDPADATPASA